MINLPSITLVAVATRDSEKALSALEYSRRGINFGKVLLIHSNHTPLMTDIWQCEIEPFRTIDDWNKYIFYDLTHDIETDYCLIIHPDGFVVNPEKWDNNWLNYDYIGSPWDIPTAKAISRGNTHGQLHRVGNSVSLRSKKLLDVPRKYNIEWRKFNNATNEDTAICSHYRPIFDEAGCKFAPVDVAVHFGREHEVPEGKGIEPFCFHKYHHSRHPNQQYKGLI